MWQFRESVRGIAEGCKTLGIPVTGGNVSFYNQTGDVPIHPTPVIGVLGVLDDVSVRTGSGFSVDEARVFLLGETRDELDGSEWSRVVHGHLGGVPPRVDLAHEMALSAVLQEGAAAGWFTTAHDLSQGGLAQALAESVLRHGVGVQVSLADLGVDAFTALFSESTGRVLVACSPGSDDDFLAAVGTSVPGVVDTATDGLRVTAASSSGEDLSFDIDLETLRETHTATLPAVFGR